MKVELVNNSIGTRPRLLLIYGSLLLLLLTYFFLGYYLAPPEYQSGLKNSRYWLSYSEFIGFSTITILIILPIIAFSRIIQKIVVDTELNKLEVEYINRFRLKPIIKTVKLSDTAIQISEYEVRNRNYQKTGEIIYSLILSNPSFGRLKISGQDFKNIVEVVRLFEGIKDEATIKARKTTVLKRMLKRSSRSKK